MKCYGVRWWLGLIVTSMAGFISGLPGISSGALKVLGMDAAIELSIKATTTASNFTIGLTSSPP